VLELTRPELVVEVGCGTDLLVDQERCRALDFRRWIIVEPSEAFAAAARRASEAGLRLETIQGFVEDAVSAVRSAYPDGADLVICSSVLHEVGDVDLLLAAVHDIVADTGSIHVNVPNAMSLHRRLARAMDLIHDERQLSDRNQTLAQPRVFDLGELVRTLERSAFIVEQTGGYFIKPFTHEQMELIGEILTPSMLEGLWTLGRELPDLASEIYASARPA